VTKLAGILALTKKLSTTILSTNLPLHYADHTHHYSYSKTRPLQLPELDKNHHTTEISSSAITTPAVTVLEISGIMI